MSGRGLAVTVGLGIKTHKPDLFPQKKYRYTRENSAMFSYAMFSYVQIERLVYELIGYHIQV